MSYCIVDSVFHNGKAISPNRSLIRSLVENEEAELAENIKQILSEIVEEQDYKDKEAYLFSKNHTRAIYLDGKSTWTLKKRVRYRSCRA